MKGPPLAAPFASADPISPGAMLRRRKEGKGREREEKVFLLRATESYACTVHG